MPTVERQKISAYKVNGGRRGFSKSFSVWHSFCISDEWYYFWAYDIVQWVRQTDIVSFEWEETDAGKMVLRETVRTWDAKGREIVRGLPIAGRRPWMKPTRGKAKAPDGWVRPRRDKRFTRQNAPDALYARPA